MRREHNDAAFIAGDHFRREGANGIRRAIQVVVDHVTPVGVFHLQQRLPPLNRGIGDHDIDFAELLLDLIGRCAKRRNVADVAARRLRAPPVALNLFHRLGQFLWRRKSLESTGFSERFF